MNFAPKDVKLCLGVSRRQPSENLLKAAETSDLVDGKRLDRVCNLLSKIIFFKDMITGS